MGDRIGTCRTSLSQCAKETERGWQVMLRTLSATVLVAVCLPMLAGTVLADRRAEREIRAEYAKTAQFTKQKNVEGLLRQMTPDFIYKDIKGQVLSKQMVEQIMREQYRMIQRIDQRSTTIRRIEVKGKTARVTTDEVLAFTFKDAQGKPHKLFTKARTRDTWVKTPQGWKVKMTEALSEETYVDGKKQ